MDMGRIVEAFGLVFLVIILAFVFSAIVALPTMLLWNWLMPVIFGLPIIGFWQSFGLMFLSRLVLPSSTTTCKAN